MFINKVNMIKFYIDLERSNIFFIRVLNIFTL